MPDTVAARTLARFHPQALGLALGLALVAATAAAAGSAHDAAGTDESRPGPRVVLAGANRDTLDYDRRDALPVAIATLESDGWTIQRTDSASGRIVTRWKPLKHVLARLLLGQVMARCVVDLVALPDGRTEVTIQGGLASDEDIALNPGYGAAQAVYRGAAIKWIGLVRQGLDARARQGLVARVDPPREHDAN